MTKDLTVGKPAVVLLQFIIPTFLGLLLQQVYSTVDTIIVGNRDHNCKTGEECNMRRATQELTAIGEHATPLRSRRGNTKAQEAQTGGCNDGVADS